MSKSRAEILAERLGRETAKALREMRAADERRAAARKRLYASARPTRLTAGWLHPTGSADSELKSSLENLRNRSRSLVRDSGYAKRAGEIVVTNVVGAGIGIQAQVRSSRNRLQGPLNSRLEESFERWSRAETCHTGGELCFADFERLVMQEVFEAGEVFVREHRVAFGGAEVPYALELVEAERVPHKLVPNLDGQRLAERGVRLGVERDRYYRPLGYWVRERHPGDIDWRGPGNDDVVFVPAAEMIHLRIIQRWPQSRGVPWMHAVATKINDMSGYSEAEIVAARGAANYLAFITRSLDSMDVEEQDDGTYQTELTPGIIERLEPGEDVTLAQPNRPNAQLDPFMRYMLREVAAGVGVSYESLSRDYSQSNYSSSRLALLDDRDLWRVLQMWIIRNFRDRVHRHWLSQAVLAGAIAGISVEEYARTPEKFERVKYKPRGWSWVDPTKEVDAFKEAVRAGFTTTGRVIEATAAGADLEDILEERAAELAMQQELGLVFDTDPGQARESPPTALPPVEEGEEGDGGEQPRQLRALP